MELSLQIMASFSQRSSKLPNELLPKLMNVVGATGVVVMVDGERFVDGITPSHGEITLLLAWLNQQIGQLPFACSQLSSQYADAQPYQDKAAGLLAIRLSSDMQNGIIWLRQEKPRTINWAGVYAEGLTQNASGDYHLTPRNSFEIWSETWQGRSFSWSANELALSQSIGNALSQALLNKHLDKQLTETAHSRSALLDLMPNGILITDTNRLITYVNADFERLTGYSREEMLGKPCSMLQGPESDPQQIQAIRAALNAQQPFFGEILNYRKDGSTFWNDLSISPVFDSEHQLTQFVGIQRNVTERKLLESQLFTSEMRFRQLADAAPVLIWQADVDKNRFWFNKNWLEFTGRSLQHQQGDGWAEGLHPEDSEFVLNSYVENFDRRQSYRIEYRLRRADGEYRWIDAHGVPRFSEEGEFEGYVGTCTDITDVRNSKAATDFFNVSHEMIYTTDLNGVIVDCNQRFTEITGYSRDYAIGKDVRILKSGFHDRAFYAEMWQKINAEGCWRGELINRHQNGSLTTLITTISIVYDSVGKPKRYLAVASDISSITHRRQQLEHLAYYDNLTGLPNRLLLNDRLNQSMTRVRRRGGFLAVLFIDLDGFKTINDHYGHEVGDEFLIAIGQKMKAGIRESDTLARLGGDEFVVILDDLDNEKSVELPLANLLQSCSSQISLRGLVLKVSASIGIALYPSEQIKYDTDADTILRSADQAMYAAKQQGKNRHHYFDGNIDQLIVTRNNAIQAIQTGLIEGEFELYYQPKVNMRSGKVLGVEGLIRWNHPGSELLSPSAFLPIVQNHPVGIELGYWVINQALVQISQWQAKGIDMPISINIDARQLHQPDFVENLTAAIANHPSYKAGLLEFEILETIALTDRFEANLVIDLCRQLGIEFALDDFGTGYSSITYLRQLPIKTIKLDRSFIGNITESHEDLRVVVNIMGLAADMGKQLIVEGVETNAQGEKLLAMGCELAQGYAIAKPMPASKVIDWLRDWEPAF
jgi:diguanylate cyclase (GGDEF)-like protein/PAS domain S-box-containing protein